MFGSDEKGRGGNENGDKNNLHLFKSQMKKELNENGIENMVSPTDKNFQCKGRKSHSFKIVPKKFLRALAHQSKTSSCSCVLEQNNYNIFLY